MSTRNRECIYRSHWQSLHLPQKLRIWEGMIQENPATRRLVGRGEFLSEWCRKSHFLWSWRFWRVFRDCEAFLEHFRHQFHRKRPKFLCSRIWHSQYYWSPLLKRSTLENIRSWAWVFGVDPTQRCFSQSSGLWWLVNTGSFFARTLGSIKHSIQRTLLL